MLLKGVNKRVIIIKNPESEIFEEAYFIVKSGKGFFKQAKENEMVIEANRIIADYSRQQRNLLEKEKTGKSDKPDTTKLSDKQDKPNMSGNISGMTAEIDRFLSDKIQSLEKPNKNSNNNENSNKTENKTPQVNTNPNSMADLTDEEIYEDEIFFASFENNENIGNGGNTENIKNHKNNYNNFGEPDYYENAFDYLPNSIISDISNISGIPSQSDIYTPNPKFKLISSKKAKNSKNSGKSKKYVKYAFHLPSKSFFAGIGFMSAVVIIVRVLEFIFTR